MVGTTNTDIEMRPTLEGALSDFPIADLLGLLAHTRQTGTLQVAVRPTALVTIIDGRVAFASTDPSLTVRDLLVGRAVVDAYQWQEAASAGRDAAGLGEALVAAGADRSDIQCVIQEQVIRVCETLVDQPEARFRFVRQPQSAMGDDFCCPISLLRERLGARADEWTRLREVVPSNASSVSVREVLPDDCGSVMVQRADWPVLRAITGVTTPVGVDAVTELGIFETTRAIARLWEAGTVTIDGAPASSAETPRTRVVDARAALAVRTAA
jgi:hypothetical protein